MRGAGLLDVCLIYGVRRKMQSHHRRQKSSMNNNDGADPRDVGQGKQTSGYFGLIEPKSRESSGSLASSKRGFGGWNGH